MLRYESLFITVPEITSDESGKLQSQLEKAVTAVKGAVISFERWGKYHLAYPIRKYDYGVYYLMRFEVGDEGKETVLEELKKLFGVKLADLIMRNVVVRLNPEGSLEYQRPESLEEAPSKDIDVIMKESKSILKKDRAPRKAASQEPAPEKQEAEPQAEVKEEVVVEEVNAESAE